jgi:hypothetical protein
MVIVDKELGSITKGYGRADGRLSYLGMSTRLCTPNTPGIEPYEPVERSSLISEREAGD